jgi:AbrB family looped-hinge helix DNA binding protein
MIDQRLTTDLTVGKRGILVIPVAIREALGLCGGQKLVAIVEDGELILAPVPNDPFERLREAAGDLFKGVDGVVYQRALRDEWED